MNQSFSKIWIILITAVFINGGFFAWQYFGVPKEEVIKDETANWKTYMNEEYGFKIKYPEDWKMAVDFPGRLGPGQAERREGIDPKSFNFAPSSKDLTIEENGDIILYVSPFGFNCTGKTNINTNNVSDFLRQNKEKSEIEFCKSTTYFHFSLIGTQKEIFNQILSTFRFLE